MSSETPTPWAVTCPTHHRVYLTRDEYEEQLNVHELRWRCTRLVTAAPDTAGPCGIASEWDWEATVAHINDELERGDK